MKKSKMPLLGQIAALMVELLILLTPLFLVVQKMKMCHLQKAIKSLQSCILMAKRLAIPTTALPCIREIFLQSLSAHQMTAERLIASQLRVFLTVMEMSLKTVMAWKQLKLSITTMLLIELSLNIRTATRQQILTTRLLSLQPTLLETK